MMLRSVFRARFRDLLAGLLAAWFLAWAGATTAETAPDQLVKQVADDVLQTIRTDKEIQAGNPQRTSQLIEGKLLPHFNFERMTRLSMGRYWGRADAAQQQKLVDEFRTLLVRTYSGALNNYRDHKIEVKPLRTNPGAAEVTVRTQVIQPGGQPVPIDYSMEKTAQGWKAYDVVVGGVSLVTNYREEFGNLVKESGVDGLIKALADKNRGTTKA